MLQTTLTCSTRYIYGHCTLDSKWRGGGRTERGGKGGRKREGGRAGRERGRDGLERRVRVCEGGREREIERVG